MDQMKAEQKKKKPQKMRYKVLDERALPVVYATEGSAGIDLRACLTGCCATVVPGHTEIVPSGLAVEIPEGYVGLVMIRSGLSTHSGLRLANQCAVIDSDYRGQVLIPVTSVKETGTYIEAGERIAQMVIVPVQQFELERAEELSETARGDGAMGSTGKK